MRERNTPYRKSSLRWISNRELRPHAPGAFFYRSTGWQKITATNKECWTGKKSINKKTKRVHAS